MECAVQSKSMGAALYVEGSVDVTAGAAQCPRDLAGVGIDGERLMLSQNALGKT